MSLIETLLILGPLSFLVGFALQRGNICTVLAARQIVWTGRWSRLKGLLLASLWGFLILVPLVWLDAAHFKAGPQLIPTLMTILGGVLYAVGCFVTGACIFGVCSRASSGHLSFLFAIPAMAICATAGQFSGAAPSPSAMLPSALSGSWLMPACWAAAAAGIAWIGIRRLAKFGPAGVGLGNLLRLSRWRASVAGMIIGLLGAALFATDTAWFYPAAAKRLTLYLAGWSPAFPLDSLVGGGGLFLGGIVASMSGGRLVVRRPHLGPSLKAVVGGLIIGFAWAMIPGGNDAMVLYLLPSLALNGILAYAVMLATLVYLEHLNMRYTPS